MGELWHSLTREQQRMVALSAGGVVVTLLLYLFAGTIVALAAAAITAYSLGRYRSNHRPEAPEAAHEPVTKVQPSSRPPARRRVRPAPQTPLGRLFAERPAWSGPPVGPFEPPRRTPQPEQDPYDSA
jgi:hypothetical protein